MPVESTHPEYDLRINQWSRSRDCIAGTDAIKAAGVKYLPKLGGQKQDEYNAYSERTLFYGASSRTLKGFVGLLFRKPSNVEYPEKLKDNLEKFSVEGLTIDEYTMQCANEVFKTGRIGILVDSDEDGKKKYVTKYDAENIVNWKTVRHEGQDKLVKVVLKETYEKVKDEFESEQAIQYRVLELSKNENENVVYKQRVFRKIEGVGTNEGVYAEVKELGVIPLKTGVPFDSIPFIFVNSMNNVPATSEPPLLELIDVNLSHYRTSADLEHGAHFTALPTAWVAGFDTKKELRIGSQTAWVTDKTDAKAGFLEFTGQGLESLRGLKKDKEAMMASVGARMLEEQKKAVEATDTHKIRQSGEHATVVTVAETLSDAITKALKIMADWDGVTDLDSIIYSLNTDFTSARLGAQDLTALMQTWQGGGMSQDTFLYNLQQGEILPNDVSIEDEKARIEDEESKVPAPDNVTAFKRNFTMTKPNGEQVKVEEQ